MHKYIQNEQDLAKKLESAKALIPLLTSHPLEEKEQFYVVLMPTLNNIIEDVCIIKIFFAIKLLTFTVS